MQRGVLIGALAYAIWGLFPLYWPLLVPASPTEILAHRMIWSLVTVAVVLTVRRRWSWLRAMRTRTWGQVLLAAVLISVNWGLYIYAVNNGHIIEAALGYYINPLISVALGVLALRERLRRLQWLAIAVATSAVVVLTVAAGRVPFIALTLAFSFATYGLVKKLVPLGALESLAAEGIVLAPAALGWLIVLQLEGSATMAGHGAGHVVLLVMTGLVTIVPLGAFSAAAKMLPLSVLGFLQYLTPTLQFVLGVVWAHETMSTSRWIGFGIIWVALVIFSVDVVRQSRRSSADRHPVAVAG